MQPLTTAGRFPVVPPSSKQQESRHKVKKFLRSALLPRVLGAAGLIGTVASNPAILLNKDTAGQTVTGAIASGWLLVRAHQPPAPQAPKQE